MRQAETHAHQNSGFNIMLCLAHQVNERIRAIKEGHAERSSLTWESTHLFLSTCVQDCWYAIYIYIYISATVPLARCGVRFLEAPS